MSPQSRVRQILAGVTAAATSAMTSGQAVFGAPIMASVAYVTLPIPRLVCVEVVERRFTAPRQRSNVTVMRIIAVVDVAVEAMRAVKPGASAKKHPANEPVGPIVAVGSTVIGSIVEVPVGTHGGDSNVDGNLGWRYG